jgi:SAM-dependent methyltransferase
MQDAIYKISRKLLPSSWYRSVSKSFLGRSKDWYRIETYAATFEYYKRQGMAFGGKQVAEVGSGDQYFTAFYFLADKADRVFLIEPQMVRNPEKMAAQLERFNAFTGNRFGLASVAERILCFSDLSEIPAAYDGKMDAMCSYLVLEHFNEIETFFDHTARLLAPDGKSCNRVDLSDHTYHVLGKYKFANAFATRRSLFHLRYSDAFFKLLNDPKCFMNRKLLPEYLDLAAKYRLRVAGLEKRINDEARVHSDLLKRHPQSDPMDLKVVDFTLMLKPGLPAG